MIGHVSLFQILCTLVSHLVSCWAFAVLGQTQPHGHGSGNDVDESSRREQTDRLQKYLHVVNTMAEIYTDQGRFEKVVQVYEKKVERL